MTSAAPLRLHLPGVNRQKVQLVARALRLRVDDDLNVARAQASPQTEEAERELRRNLEARDEHAAPLLERLLYSLLDLRAVRHVHEVCEHALALALSSPEEPFACGAFGAAARLYDDGERWQETLRVADRDDDGRRLAREDVVGEACGDDEVAQGGSRRSPRDEERRGQDGEDYEEEVVARVPRGEGDDRVDAYEDDAARRHLKAEVEPRRLRARRACERRHDEDDDEHGEQKRRNRAEPRQLPVAAPARDHCDDRRAHAAQDDERTQYRITPTLQAIPQSRLERCRKGMRFGKSPTGS